MKQLLLVLFFIPILLLGQKDDRANQELYKLSIQRAKTPIHLDGILDEADWAEADVASDFWQKSPKADVKAVLRTEVRLTYDENFLYVGAICFDSTNHVISTLKRDVGYWGGDAFGVILDPLNEATSGFMFGTNPYGVQNDILLGGGSGPRNYNDEWDNRWFVETNIESDRWTIEFAIPFKTLRFESGRDNWGINFMRNDKKNNRLDIWAQIPLQFWLIDLGYAGKLEWDQAPKKGKRNVNVIPYVNGSSFNDFSDEEPAENSFDAGLDAKITLTPSLNLDLTVNPDFSQVEVDQQVTNLTRFSVFLSERRTFFLENSDIFSQIGFPQIQPFFSRRIGLDENGQAVPILFGARLTGNATGTTRIGILNVQTKETADQLAQNFTAASFSQRIFKRSRLQGMFINRQAFQDGEAANQDFGRNMSLKFNYLNQKGTFEFWSGVHRSIKYDIDNDNYFFENGVGYSNERFSITGNHIYLGNNYFADVGFLNRVNNYDAERDTTIRLGYHYFLLPIEYRILPKNSRSINQHSLSYEGELTLDPKETFVEQTNVFDYQIEFKNSSDLSFSFENTTTDLRFPFTFTDATPLPIGRYQYNQANVSYGSDDRKLFQYGIDFGAGSFYNGTITSASLALLYRRQPWGNFGVEIEFNDLKFPDPYGATRLWAFSPRVEINFNRNMFWTTFLQYNTQLDNFNINSRFQWRFAPMSDIFLVYTDNYTTADFEKKNRALVFKLSYWLVL